LWQVCIEALSINLDKRQLDYCSRNIASLRTKVDEVKAADQERLNEEYRRLVEVRFLVCWLLLLCVRPSGSLSLDF